MQIIEKAITPNNTGVEVPYWVIVGAQVDAFTPALVVQLGGWLAVEHIEAKNTPIASVTLEFSEQVVSRMRRDWIIATENGADLDPVDFSLYAFDINPEDLQFSNVMAKVMNHPLMAGCTLYTGPSDEEEPLP